MKRGKVTCWWDIKLLPVALKTYGQRITKTRKVDASKKSRNIKKSGI